MSKVNAIICNCCGALCHEIDCMGINPIEDLHDKYASFPIIHDCSKADIHYCMNCYRRHVEKPIAKHIQDNETYNYERKIMFFTFRRLVIQRFNKIKQATNNRKLAGKRKTVYFSVQQNDTKNDKQQFNKSGW